MTSVQALDWNIMTLMSFTSLTPPISPPPLPPLSRHSSYPLIHLFPSLYTLAKIHPAGYRWCKSHPEHTQGKMRQNHFAFTLGEDEELLEERGGAGRVHVWGLLQTAQLKCENKGFIFATGAGTSNRLAAGLPVAQEMNCLSILFCPERNIAHLALMLPIYPSNHPRIDPCGSN